MNMTEMPLISVIVPVYGTEKYLRKCINSILAQTYNNIELIIVNDGSRDNSEVIIKEYMVRHDNIKYVCHTQNRGLFRARISGAEEASGEYIAFVDSDDYISCDWYRMLINKALETNADIVAGDWAYEDGNGQKSFLNLDNLRVQDLDLKGNDIMDAFMCQRGLCFSWHTVWNKIYKKSLWDKCMPFYYSCAEQRPHLTMCEDLAFSSALWSNAEHVVNEHGAYYFYFIREGSTVNSQDNVGKFNEKITDVKFVFDFFKTALENRGIYSRYDKYYRDFRKRYAAFWYSNALRVNDTYASSIIYDEMFGDCGHKPISKEDDIFLRIRTEMKSEYEWSEDIKYGICSPEIKYVSFDMFDTLVCRPLWKPEDIFELMNKEFNKLMGATSYINFKDIRMEAERDCRELHCRIYGGTEDITIDDIYNYLAENFCVSKDICDKLKEREIALEIKFCNVRKKGKTLFELAKQQGKNVIIISDMYLPLSVLERMLEKNGYTGYSKVYVSSEYGLLKNSGNLFRAVLSELGIEKEPSCMLHIGDNWNSDVDMPNRIGIRTGHLAKSKDIFCNSHSTIYGGEAFKNVYTNNGTYNDSALCVENYLGLRCMLASAANRIFDSGYNSVNHNSDFNCDPYFIGYYALGMHLLAIAKWLVDETDKNGYDVVHFVSRDGWLPLRAFKVITDALNRDVKTDYLYISRKATAPMQIRNRSDLYSLAPVVNIFAFTPEKMINLIKAVLDPEKVEKAKEICLKNSFVFEKRFGSKREFNRFVTLLANEFFSENQVNAYHNIMRGYFDSIIGSNDAFFDLGYAARNESIFSHMLGKKINTYFVHTNQDIAYVRADMFKFNIHTFYDHKPAACTVIREHTFCELGPSCVSYSVDNGNVTPKFEEYEVDSFTYFVTNIMQQGALDFVKDFMDNFAEYFDEMSFRNFDASLPYEYFNHCAKKFDRNIFAVSSFEDDVFGGRNVEFVPFWEENMKNINSFDKIKEDITPKPYDTKQYTSKLNYYFTSMLMSKGKNFGHNRVKTAMFMDKVESKDPMSDKYAKCAGSLNNIIEWEAAEKLISPLLIDNWYMTNPGGFSDGDFDIFLTTGLTEIHENTDLTYLGKVLDKIGNCPLLPITVGFCTGMEKTDFQLDAESVNVLRRIAERCKSIGVKGDYSAEVLKGLGINNVRIVGTTALYANIPAEKSVNNSVAKIGNVSVSFRPFYGTFSENEIKLLKYFADNSFRLVCASALELDETNIKDGRLLEKLRQYEQTKKMYFNSKEWTSSFGGIDFAMGMNFYNNSAALAAGVPALFINYETTGREMCRFFGLPSIEIGQFDAKKPIEHYYRMADYSVFTEKLDRNFEEYRAYLAENGITFDAAMRKVIEK